MKQLFTKCLENIEWIITGILLIIMPAVYSTKVLDPVLFPRYLALSIWVLVISIVLTIKNYKGQFALQLGKQHKIIFGFALLYILLNIISSFQAINKSEAIFKTFKEFTLLVSFFYFFQMMKNNEKGRDYLIKSIIIMSLGFLAIGVNQLLEADFTKFRSVTSDYGYWFRQAIAHVKSTLTNINPFASYLFLSLAFSIYGSIVYKKIWRALSIIAMLGAMVFIFILASKASWGALGLAMLVLFILTIIYLFYVIPNKKNKQVSFWAKYAIMLLPFIVFFGSMYLVEKTEIAAVRMVVDKVQQVLNPEESLNAMYNTDNPSSAQTRTLVWANTIQMARDNPFLGVGPGQWRIVYAKYGIDAFSWDIRNGGKHFQRTHNDFLWVLGELGYTGLFLFLCIYIGVLALAFKNFSRADDAKTSIFNAVAFAFLIGFMVNLFVSFPRERISHNIMYLMLFALVLSFTNKNNSSYTIKRSISIGLFVLFVGLSVFNIRLAWDMVKGDKGAMYIKYATTKQDIPIMARGLRVVGENSYYTLDPFAVPISYYSGTVLHRNKRLEEAKQAFIKASHDHPYHIRVLSDLGTSYDVTGDKQKALEFYYKALEISPRFEEALVNVAIVKYNLNETSAALDYLAKVPMSSKNPPQFTKAYITVCRKRGAELADQVDIKKLEVWYKDENKIKDTFVRFQREKGNFDKILLQEIGN